jgi:hypothetical protein
MEDLRILPTALAATGGDRGRRKIPAPFWRGRSTLLFSTGVYTITRGVHIYAESPSRSAEAAEKENSIGDA